MCFIVYAFYYAKSMPKHKKSTGEFHNCPVPDTMENTYNRGNFRYLEYTRLDCWLNLSFFFWVWSIHLLLCKSIEILNSFKFPTPDSPSL